MGICKMFLYFKIVLSNTKMVVNICNQQQKSLSLCGVIGFGVVHEIFYEAYIAWIYIFFCYAK